MKDKKIWAFFIGLVLIVPSFLFSAQTEEIAKKLEENKAGILSLIVYGSDKQEMARGSALAVSEGIVATSYHLVSQAAQVEAFNFKQKKVKVEGIISFDKNTDIALLNVKGKISALPMGNFNSLSVGKKVYAMGVNPLEEIEFKEGSIKGILEFSAAQKFADLTLDVQESFTGAPVCDESGLTVGLLIIIEKKLKFIVPIQNVQALPKTGEGTPFKKWTADNYLATMEGAYLVGKLYALTNDYWGAQRYLDKVIQLNPKNLEVHILMASILDSQRNYQAALTAYNKIIALDPGNADAYSKLGQVYLKMQRLDEAVDAFKKAVELNPNNKQVLFYLGNAFEENRDFAKAAEAYEQYVGTQPDNAWKAYRQLGLCRLNLNQYEKAIAAFLEALKGQPEDFKSNYNLAEAYEKAGQFEKAEEVYHFLIKKYPSDAESYYKMIILMYDRAGMNAKAVDAAKKLVELNPKNEEYIYNLGIMYFKIEKYQEAIEAFQKAAALKPNYDYAYYQIGFSYQRMKKYKESIEAFQEYVGLVPNSPDGWFSIGINHMFLKDFNGALEPLRKCLEIDPGYQGGVAYYNLGIVYLNLRDRYSAIEVHKKLAAISPDLANKLKALIYK
ncbi:MAG: tetratricopeptide repeat protein [Candidatus Aminicenantales bacterium]